MGIVLSLQGLGRVTEAEPLLRQAMEGYNSLLGPDDKDTIDAIGHLAYCLAAQGRVIDAEELFAQAAESCRRSLGPEHPETKRAEAAVAACVNQREVSPCG